MQATIYLSASIQFEQKQIKSKCEQGLFESEVGFGGKNYKI